MSRTARPRIGIGWRAHLGAMWGEDPSLSRFLLVYAAVQLLIAQWDLPSSWSWEEDAVAPRELFMGIVNNLKPGSFHRYPLFHYVLYGLLSLPVSIYGLLTADAWTARAIEASFIRAEVMTGIAFVTKLLTVAMGAVALWALARIARRTVSAAAGRWAVAFAVVNLSVGYYFRTQNLDGPYLMWTALAMDRLLTIADQGRRRDYLLFAFFTAASIATKDQAYAAYVLVGPLYLLVFPAVKPSAWAAGRGHFRRLVPAIGLGALTLGVLGGGLLNPTGFAARVRFLTGPASQNFRGYSRDAEGFLTNLSDVFWSQPEFWWPAPIVVAAWLGVAVAIWLPSEGGLRSRVWRLLPLTAAVSSLGFFTLVVGRCEHRFVLPMGLWLSYHLGVLVAVVGRHVPRSRVATVASLAVVAMVGLVAARRPVALVLTQWFDARHAVESFLAGLPPGAVVETYGRLPHQPRFDPDGPYQVVHVHPDKSARQRPPMPGVRLLQAPLEDLPERAPHVVVWNPGLSGRYKEIEPEREGRITSVHQKRFQTNPREVELMRALFRDELPGYSLVRDLEPALPRWATTWGLRKVRIHGCTGGRFRLYARDDLAPALGD